MYNKVLRGFSIQEFENRFNKIQGLMTENNIDAILIDAWDANSLGGTGNRVPLELLLNKNFKSPWILAGGISAEIITEIFSKINPDGIDASSRLEISPGIKDLKKVESLVREIREQN